MLDYGLFRFGECGRIVSLSASSDQFATPEMVMNGNGCILNRRMTQSVMTWPKLAGLIVVALLATRATHAQIIVTAVRDGSHNLKLISWNENGDRLNGDGAQAGKVHLISAVRLGNSDLIATAVRDDSLKLTVIIWKVHGDGQIERRETGRAGEIDLISAVSNPSGDRLVTAVRDGAHNLKVILWAVTPDGVITRLGHGEAGQITHAISATFVDNSGTLLATALGDANHNLKIITWRVAKFGCITRLKEASAGEISEISISAQDGSRLVTAVRDGAENLKLIAWNVDQDGTITRAQEAQAGAANNISAFPLLGSRLVTAVRDGNDNLKLIAWDASPGNSRIKRVAEGSAGEVSRIAGCRTGPSTPPIFKFQTSVRDGSDNLKIIPWTWDPSSTIITRFTAGEGSAGEVSRISTVCF